MRVVEHRAAAAEAIYTSVWRAPMRAVDNSVFDGDRSENEDMYSSSSITS